MIQVKRIMAAFVATVSITALAACGGGAVKVEAKPILRLTRV